MATTRRRGRRACGLLFVGTAVGMALGLLLHSFLPAPVPSEAVVVRPQRGLQKEGICNGDSCADEIAPSIGHVFLDKPLYRPGEVLRFRLWAFNAITNTRVLMIGGPRWSVLDASDAQVAQGTAVGDRAAKFSGWRLPHDTKGGQYKLVVTMNGMPDATHDFQVRAFRSPQLLLDCEFMRDSYSSGDPLTAIVRVTRADGSPVSSDCHVTVTAHFSLLDGSVAVEDLGRVPAPGGNIAVSTTVPSERLTGDGYLLVAAEDGGILESVVRLLPLVGSAVDIEFVPESRNDLLHGIENVIFFSVKDMSGRAIDARGSVIEHCAGSATSETIIADVATIHDGKGFFVITPSSDCTYSYSVRKPAAVPDVLLPPVRSKGALISVSDGLHFTEGGRLQLSVLSTAHASRLEVQLFRKATMVSAADVLADGMVEIDIPSGYFGVMRLMLLLDGTVESERLVFVQPSERRVVSVDIDVPRDTYLPGEEVTLKIRTMDSSDTPVRSSVAVTVTDNTGWSLTELRKRPARLPERLLISDEVEEDLGGGRLLSQFYDGVEPSEEDLSRLDMLLAVQSWRRFAYDDPEGFKQSVEDRSKAERMLSLPRPLFTLDRGMVMMGLQGGMPGMEMEMMMKMDMTMEESSAKGQDPSGPSDDVVLDRNDRALLLEQSIPVVAAVFAHGGPPEGLSGGERYDWTQTVFWSATQETDDNGELSVSFVLSHSMTSMRVMVDVTELPSDLQMPTASDFARMGVAERLFSVREPLFIEPKLPRHMTVGDRAIVPITVNNRGAEMLMPSIALTSVGDALLAPDASRNLGVTSSLPAGLSSRHLLDLRATSHDHMDFFTGIDSAVTLSATESEALYSDTVSRIITVKPEGVPATSESSGQFRGSADEQAIVTIDLSALREAAERDFIVKGSVGGQVRVYRTPLQSLIEAVKALARRPCGCFEQASSSHFPNLMVLDFLQSMGYVAGEHAAFYAQTLQLIEEGYEKLVSFETDEDGFEWFGASPPHEALTAYGLLEFTAMDRLEGVYVSKELLERTRKLLLALREGNSFKRNPQALDSFGRAPPDVTTSYIVWALANSGVESHLLTKQIAHLCDTVRTNAHSKRFNTYVTALLVDSLYVFGMLDEAREMASILRSAFDAEGNLLYADSITTITMSGGTSKEVETLSLAVLAMLHDPESFGSLLPACFQQVLERCTDGTFGSTQSTVLGLRAILAYWRQYGHGDTVCRTTVRVGSREVGALNTDTNSLDISPFIQMALENEEQLILASECPKLMFSTSVAWRQTTVPPPTMKQFSFSVELDRTLIEENESTEIVVEWCNHMEQSTSMLIAEIGIPGGLELDNAALDKAVTDNRIAFYEFASDNSVLYLYWRDSVGGQCAKVATPAIAAVPGVYSSSAARFYQYYDDEKYIWTNPLQVDIAPVQ